MQFTALDRMLGRHHPVDEMREVLRAAAGEVELAAGLGATALRELLWHSLADRPRDVLIREGRRYSQALGPTVVRVAQLGRNFAVRVRDGSTLNEKKRIASDVAEQLRALAADLR